MYGMACEQNILEIHDDTITINTPADAHYWAQRLSISSFTLFHLVRTVGNRLTDIVEFLHKADPLTLRRPKSGTKVFTIL
jgi:hypothetical protein